MSGILLLLLLPFVAVFGVFAILLYLYLPLLLDLLGEYFKDKL